MKNVLLILSFCILNQIFSQGVIITSPASISKPNNSFSLNNKRALGDTIILPFFDDFTSTKPYPDSRLWIDSFANVNDVFAISPPSIGVATLDNLNKKGIPYRSISASTHGESDHLTSKPINLKNYISGLNTIDYKLADSIYFSFFYQTQGLGDPLDFSDSLVLKFKDSAGKWATVWKTIGQKNKKFNQVLIPILKTKYLYSGFQFKFINYTKNTGNMNQWHLDYIRMKSSRNRNDTTIADVAINQVPKGPLRWFESLPYNHFKANISNHLLGYHSLKIRNNFNSGVNVQYKAEVRNRYNQLIQDYPLSASARNINLFSDSVEKFNTFRFDTLSGTFPSFRIKYNIFPLSNDVLPDNYEALASNNEYTKTVQFGNTYNYDDGSAEGGFGLDYGSLPDGPGYIAIKFENSLADTLRGIQLFYNRSVEDVEFKSYFLTVWKAIGEPPAVNMDNDVILRKQEVRVEYNPDGEFITIPFDTSVFIPKGTYYIGWQQNNRYILNLGYDNNYLYNHTGGRNPNLFFNLNGYWEKVNSNITGAVMMRPIFGAPIPKASNINVQSKNNIKIYPNPIQGHSKLNIESENPIISVQLIDITGKTIDIQYTENEGIDVSELNSGVYFINITTEQNIKTTFKFIKTN